jgi:glycosyltransferase involved in cell wall biosynthesis
MININENKISCVIHTFNSEKYLEQCLQSVLWCDEIVVIDMHSTDSTIEIATQYNANIYMHDNLGYADPARAFGVEKCQNSWILALDSDELITHSLSQELIKKAGSNVADVFLIGRRNFFFGKELKGGGWGHKQDIIPRFFKKNYILYNEKIHDFIEIVETARIEKIIEKDKSIIHFNYDDVTHFIKKIITYSSLEVISNFSKYKNNPGYKIIKYTLRAFFGRYLILKGYRDGWLGLYLALGIAFYKTSAVARANLPDKDKVLKQYVAIASEKNK